MDPSETEIETSMICKMVYEDSRLKTFTESGRWPFPKDCNCTPEQVRATLIMQCLFKFWFQSLILSSLPQMASAGFYWCGSATQPDLVRCFVCLKEFEDWEPNDNPRYYYFL